MGCASKPAEVCASNRGPPPPLAHPFRDAGRRIAASNALSIFGHDGFTMVWPDGVIFSSIIAIFFFCESQVICMVTTRPPKTIVKPTALGPVADTDTKLLIYGLFQKGRVLAQDAVAEQGG